MISLLVTAVEKLTDASFLGQNAKYSISSFHLTTRKSPVTLTCRGVTLTTFDDFPLSFHHQTDQ